jgi:hypothetical protein
MESPFIMSAVLAVVTIAWHQIYGGIHLCAMNML